MYDQFLDEVVDEIESISGYESFAAPLGMPSCEPGKFESGKLNVVRWWKRTSPDRRQIPSDLALAILTRGRMRLPFESIKWILDSAKKPHNFISRLPSNMASLFPEVDVTVELYLMQFILDDRDISNTLDLWLRRRHETELPNCSMFYAAYWRGASEKLDIESNLRLSNFGLNLDKLYKKAGIPLTGRSADEDFILLVYASFPNALEKFLKPDIPKIKPSEIPLTIDEIRALVWGIIGEKPKEFSILRESASVIWDAFKVRRAKGFLTMYFKMLFRGFEERPLDDISAIIGSTYALMDAALGTVREKPFEVFECEPAANRNTAFRNGYDKMQQHVFALKGIPILSNYTNKMLLRLRVTPDRGKSMNIIYKALLSVYQGNGYGRVTAAMLANCKFLYPRISCKCGP